MARLAIFLDGGYVDKLAMHEFNLRVAYDQFSEAVADHVRSGTHEPVDLLRTFYYHCPPYQSNPPTSEEAKRFGQTRSFFQALRRLAKYEVREGRLAFRGLDAQGDPIFQQKRVDLLLGLDFALLAGKQQITHAALVTGDSDLIPAVTVAKREGVAIWLVHGPRRNKKGESTYAQELWDAVDDRLELTQDFMNAVSR
jgi:uncharacterized LabA/DUF88 family protein